MIFSSRDLQDLAEFMWSPGSFRSERGEREGTVAWHVPIGCLCFENLEGCTEEVLSIDFSSQVALANEPGNDSAGRGKYHADEKENRGNEHDDGTRRELRCQGADPGSEPSTDSTDHGREEHHGKEPMGPETRGGRRGNEKGNDQNESDGLETDHGDGSDQSEEKDVEGKGRPALGSGIPIVETEKEKFFQKKQGNERSNSGDDGNQKKVGLNHGGRLSVDEGFQSGGTRAWESLDHLEAGDSNAKENAEYESHGDIVAEPCRAPDQQHGEKSGDTRKRRSEEKSGKSLSGSPETDHDGKSDRDTRQGGVRQGIPHERSFPQEQERADESGRDSKKRRAEDDKARVVVLQKNDFEDFFPTWHKH